MSRRDNADARCLRCRLHLSLCMCAVIPSLATATRLVLFIHHREDKKTTNTGRLACLCLPNSEMVVRGEDTQPTPPFVADPQRLAVLLFPAEDAVPLETFSRREKPVTLVVPDGTWRQASKVRNRVAGLKALPCVSLPPGPTTRYQLRTETRDAGLATFEAIARAMGVLEGPTVQAEMERAFDVMVARTLWARGTLLESQVPGGIPVGAVRHDPRSGTP